jgi:hypothetical protein
MQSEAENNESAVPRPLFPTRLYLLHPWSRAHLIARDGRSRTSCAARHLHVQVQWWKCKGIVGTIPALHVTFGDDVLIGFSDPKPTYFDSELPCFPP